MTPTATIPQPQPDTSPKSLHFIEALQEGEPILMAIQAEVIAGRPVPQLTPEQIDQCVAEYLEAETELDVYKSAFTVFKDALVATVKTHGHVPPHAEQSRRLTGRRNVATITTGTIINVKEDAVRVLEDALDTAGLNYIFPRLFACNIKHALIDGASNVLATIDLPKRTHEKILSLFGRCIDPKPKAPSLKVELIEAEKPAKKPRAGKVAA